MKANVRESFRGEDFERLERGFNELSQWETPFGDWRAIALDGAAAAERGDTEGARLACRACHDSYKARYREACNEGEEQ